MPAKRQPSAESAPVGSDSLWIVEHLDGERWVVLTYSTIRRDARDALGEWRRYRPGNRYRLTRYVSTRKGERRGKR